MLVRVPLEGGKMKKDPLNKYYADLLRKAREKVGLTQAELGMQAGLPQERISRMERGISSISLPDYVRVMQVLGVQHIKVLLPGEPGLKDI
jgi:transcriptional regulator with XRE-family HTH domain